jgi:NDP-sugar pyrophosphorylase family protein
MKAMILAAGLGTRLRPLTLERAKPAIPLLGKPLVCRITEKLKALGVFDFRLNLHHLPETVEAAFEDCGDETRVSFSYEQEILGTAGGLKANESFFTDETFIMANGDILFDFDLREALDFHKRMNAFATLILVPQEPPYPFYPIRIDKEFRLRRFKGEWPGGSLTPEIYVFSGIHILEPGIFDYIPAGGFCEINDEVYPKALAAGKPIFGFPVSGYWDDLGTPARYLAAQNALFRKRPEFRNVYYANGNAGDQSAGIGPYVSIGRNCSIQSGVELTESILWDDVRLAGNSKLRNCILGSGVRFKGVTENKVITSIGQADID